MHQDNGVQTVHLLFINPSPSHFFVASANQVDEKIYMDKIINSKGLTAGCHAAKPLQTIKQTEKRVIRGKQMQPLICNTWPSPLPLAKLTQHSCRPTNCINSLAEWPPITEPLSLVIYQANIQLKDIQLQVYWLVFFPPFPFFITAVRLFHFIIK